WMYDAYVMPLFLALVCVPMIALGDIHDGIARASDWMKLALSPTFLARPVLILVLMAAALAADFPHTASTAMGASVAAVWLVGLVQMLVLSRKLPKVVDSGPRVMKTPLWIKIALPIFLVEGFFNLLFNVDIIMAGLLLSPDEVGVYFACVKVLALIHFVSFAVRAAGAHRFSQYHSEGDTLRLGAFAHDTVRWTFWPSLAMAGFLIIIGKPVLMLFGPGFADGYHLLFILAVGIVARASVGPGEMLLSMSGHQNACAALYGVTLVVAIILNLALIPLYGLTGAAIATASAMIFEALALYSVVMRRLGLHLFVFFHPATPSKEAR
ncbi:MAG: lipopolysaccharide biosynthesis protein, partial [Pseudomonadota bacterium]